MPFAHTPLRSHLMRALLSLSVLSVLFACAPLSDDPAQPGPSAHADLGPHHSGFDASLDAWVAPTLDEGVERPTDPDDGVPPRQDATADAALDPDLGPQGTILNIATYNVRRHFDAECQSGRCGPNDFEYQPSQTNFLRRVEEIARGIYALNADVVLLQEVENRAALDPIANMLNTLGRSYQVVLVPEVGGAGSMNIGVLARGQMTRMLRHEANTELQLPNNNRRTTFTREFLELELNIDGQRVIVFNAHFRSKVNDDPGRRLAEARAAREIILARAAADPDALIVFGGDLNDTPDSEPVQDLIGDGELQRLAQVLGDDDYTLEYEGQLIAIDHLFQAQNRTAIEFISDSPTIFRGREGPGYAGSDHAALRASFLFPLSEEAH